jgi:cytochrome c-type biogenesis protein CcmH
MTPFAATALFLGVAGLAVVAALAFVLPFLLRQRRATADPALRRDVNLAVYRDQMRELKAELAQAQVSPEQFQADRLELEARAAADALAPPDGATPAQGTAPAPSRRLGLFLAAVLPIAAFGLYAWLGNPAVLTAVAGGQGVAGLPARPTPEDILGMIPRIEARTVSHPSDPAAWEALAVANAVVARWPQAVQAYAQADRLQPDTPSILTGYAESLAMSSDQTLAGRPIELVDRALRIDPNHPKALELAGIHAYQTQDFARAVVMLDRLVGQMAPDTPRAREVLTMRDEAQRRAQAGAAGAAAATSPTAGPSGPGGASAGPGVSGRVAIAAALQSRVRPQDTVFVLARAGNGGPPLAAVRVAAGAMPMRFELNDSLAMIPGHVLSGHQAVTLVARVSASGNPIPQPGDLEGELSGVRVGSTDVNLVIDRVRP